MIHEIDWDPIRELAQSVLERNEPLVLTETTRALLRQSAREVAISADAVQAALDDVARATDLLREIRERIRQGSDRLSPALRRMYRLRDMGDLEGARRQMEEVLAVEVVPLYRDIAAGELEKLDKWKLAGG